MSEDDDDKKLPAIQNRLIGAAVEIDQDDPLGIVYQHSCSARWCCRAAGRRARLRASLPKQLNQLGGGEIMGWNEMDRATASRRPEAAPCPDPHQQPSRENAQPLRGHRPQLRRVLAPPRLKRPERQHLRAVQAANESPGRVPDDAGLHRRQRSRHARHEAHRRIQGMDGNGAKPARPVADLS